MVLKTGAGYEIVERSFRPLERLRTVEFYRDWGLDYQPIAATEHLPFVKLEYADSANNLLQVQSSAYLRDDGYKGLRQLVVQKQKIKGWQFNNVFSLTNITPSGRKVIF
jgi:hypothetical protein